MERFDKPLVWLAGQIKTPPLSHEARLETGFLLRRLQQGESIAMPHAKHMPSIGRRCLELRVPDRDQTWRIICRIDDDAIVILDVFSKKTQQTPPRIIEQCKARLRRYDELV
ncbi:MAG: type II toxin-antitoxin system RelE/ParE family toxin [Phycisphaeraceae bacterium]